MVRTQKPGAVVHGDVAGRSRWPATAAPGPTACWTCGGCGRTSQWSAGSSAAAPGTWLPRSAASPLRLCLPCNRKPGLRVQGSGQPHAGVTTAAGRRLLCERVQNRDQVKRHAEDTLIGDIQSMLCSVPVGDAACVALALARRARRSEASCAAGQRQAVMLQDCIGAETAAPRQL